VELFFACPFLDARVILTARRLFHILEKHPEALPDGIERLGDVLRRPDCVRASARDSEVLLFSRWYDELLMGKHLVVVVRCDSADRGSSRVLTAYAARDLGPGEVLWHTS